MPACAPSLGAIIMRRELAAVSSSLPALPLAVGHEAWDLFVFGVYRVGPSTFVQLAALGPRACTASATVRVDANLDRDLAAREVLTAMRQWLATGDLDRHAFLESPSARTHAS
jgi:hypothetical protein